MLGFTLLDKVRNTSRENQNNRCSSLLQKIEVGIRRENCKRTRELDNRLPELNPRRKTGARKTKAKMGGRDNQDGRRKLEDHREGQKGLE